LITKMDKVLKISRRGFLIGQKSSSSLIGRRSCSSGIGGDGVNEVLEAAEGEALTPSENRLGGFAKAFDKMTDISAPPAPSPPPPTKAPQSFHTLLRNSKLMQLGDPKDKMVVGRVFHVVENNLFVDFGGKFYAVVDKPRIDKHMYVRGSLVSLRLFELEMSTRFLGSNTDMTLNEADARIRNLIWSPRGKGNPRANIPSNQEEMSQ